MIVLGCGNLSISVCVKTKFCMPESLMTGRRQNKLYPVNMSHYLIVVTNFQSPLHQGGFFCATQREVCMSAKGYCFLVIILISAFFVNLRWFSPYQALFIVTFIWGTYNQLRIDKMAEQVKNYKKASCKFQNGRSIWNNKCWSTDEQRMALFCMENGDVIVSRFSQVNSEKVTRWAYIEDIDCIN